MEPERVLAILAEHDVNYVVIGGVAGQLLGAPLITYDLDICYERTRENAERLVTALRQLGANYRGAPPDLPFQLDATTIRNGDSFPFTTHFGSFDCLGTPSGSGGYEQLKMNAVSIVVGDIEVDVAALEDLIQMKRATGRTKDLLAVEELASLRDRLDGIEDTWEARKAFQSDISPSNRPEDVET